MRPLVKPGMRFGNLVVIEETTRTHPKKKRWACRCDCGNTAQANSEKLTGGVTSHCGCLTGANISSGRAQHGHARVHKRSIEYQRWCDIIKRCENKFSCNYIYYGGRGITVSDSWRASFEQFFADMGECPPGYEIDRIDNSKGYSADNCRWVPISINRRNMSTNKLVTIDGVTKPVVEWCEEFKLPPNTVYQRIYRGWDESRWFIPKHSFGGIK